MNPFTPLPLALVGPAVEPVTLAEAKLFLRVDDAAEDDLIAALVAAARLTLEGATRLAFLTQIWRLRVPGWAGGVAPGGVGPGAIAPRGVAPGGIALTLAPIQAVEAVRIGSGPEAIAVPPEDWRLDDTSDPPRLLIDPTSRSSGQRPPLEIDLRIGFGDTPAAVPAPLRLAMRRLVARWYENRGDATPGPADLRGEIAALIAPYIRPRLA